MKHARRIATTLAAAALGVTMLGVGAPAQADTSWGGCGGLCRVAGR